MSHSDAYLIAQILVLSGIFLPLLFFVIVSAYAFYTSRLPFVLKTVVFVLSFAIWFILYNVTQGKGKTNWFIEPFILGCLMLIFAFFESRYMKNHNLIISICYLLIGVAVWLVVPNMQP